MSDAVNHPKHYNAGKYEVIDVIEDWGFGDNFCLGNAIKYIARCEHKGKKIEDLKKTIWYIQREIAREEKAQAEKIRINDEACREYNEKNPLQTAYIPLQLDPSYFSQPVVLSGSCTNEWRENLANRDREALYEKFKNRSDELRGIPKGKVDSLAGNEKSSWCVVEKMAAEEGRHVKVDYSTCTCIGCTNKGAVCKKCLRGNQKLTKAGIGSLAGTYCRTCLDSLANNEKNYATFWHKGPCRPPITASAHVSYKWSPPACNCTGCTNKEKWCGKVHHYTQLPWGKVTG